VTAYPAPLSRVDGDRVAAAPATSSSPAGWIGSAQLLLLSGIGPADDLRPLGVDVRADLAGVGANLHDHALATILYSAGAEGT